MDARIEHRNRFQLMAELLLASLIFALSLCTSHPAYAVDEGVEQNGEPDISLPQQSGNDSIGADVSSELQAAVDQHPSLEEDKCTGWKMEGSSRYYLINGNRLAGMQTIDGSVYYFDPASDSALSYGWVFTDNKWFYADQSGALVSGWRYIGGQWYWFDSLEGCALVTGRRVIDGHPYLLGAYGLVSGWCLDGDVWYYGQNGEVLTGWLFTGNRWYWLDPANDGAMSKGVVSIGSVKYYLTESGAMAVGWAFDGANWYYADSSGSLACGWRFVNGAWYWLDSDGIMTTGILHVGDADYYLKPSGAMTVGWAFDGLNWYYAENSGTLASGWRSIGGSWYWLDGSNGHKMVTGFMPIDANQYHFADSGALSFGWFVSDSDWYYSEPVNASGIVKTGWLTINGAHYYLDPMAGGKMSIGRFAADGKDYYAKTSGALACREWVDVQDSAEAESYKVFAGSDCILTGALRAGKLFISNGDGDLVQARGFVTLGGCKFYIDPADGPFCSGWRKVDGSWYFFDEYGGYARFGWLYKDGSWFYLDPSTFVMKTGWISVDGSWYYLNSSGYMQTGWINLGGTWYWLDSSGVMATGWHVVDGSWQCFMSNGAWVSDYMDAKAQGYSSNTNWLILVDTSRCLTSIYTGSRGNWSLNRRYVCSTGKASTPTVLGEYQVYGKGYSFGHGYTCYYYTQFYGDYLFHSSPYYVNSNQVMDPTMGVPSSAGCVRLEIQNAKWIYDNIPYGTKVVTY